MADRRIATSLVVSALAVASIAGYEGFRERAYDDGVGVQTIGFGSTHRADGTPVQRGDRTDPVRAVRQLAADADATARALAACIGPVPLTQGEFDAYVSWAYNVGTTAACRSTLVRKLKQTPPDYAGACAELLKWTRAGGRELPGLVKRRRAEYQECIGSTP